MDLTANKRADDSKKDAKRLRREGKIPAVIYGPNRENESIEIDAAEFQAALREIKKGTLSTKIFTLNLGGKKRQVLVKDIQYEVTSYDVLHLDFVELQEDIPVMVKVPVQCVGMADCAGIKLGGVLRQVIRQVKVKCLPKDIPTEFELDIRALKMKQTRRLSDIVMPEGVRPIAATDEVVALITKR